MLDTDQRTDRYRDQNGSDRLTPRQRRRIHHKAGHQQPDAAASREERATDRAKTRAQRARQNTPRISR